MESAILFGPCVGELYWELARFATHVIWKRLNKYPKGSVKFIVMTKQDRFDIYGKHADILVPLHINEENLVPDCFGLRGLDNNQFDNILKKFKEKYKEQYKIKNHIYPNITGKTFKVQHQYPRSQLEYNKFDPRSANSLAIEQEIPNDKKLVVIGSRFKNKMRRNWENWQEFYDLIYDSPLFKKYHFIICGKEGEYIPDSKNRFFDINSLQKSNETSLIGLTFESLKRAFFTVGSQSAIPNISLLMKVPVLCWGHQRQLHTKTYNVLNTPIAWIDDTEYKVKPNIVLSKLTQELNEREIANGKSVVAV